MRVTARVAGVGDRRSTPPGSEAYAGGSLALPARPQPPTVCHPPSLAVEPGQENIASKPEPARKKAAGELASADKNFTSKPELARKEPAGEPAPEEKNWRKQDVQPPAGVVALPDSSRRSIGPRSFTVVSRATVLRSDITVDCSDLGRRPPFPGSAAVSSRIPV